MCNPCPFRDLIDDCVYMDDDDEIHINAGNSDAKCREALEKLKEESNESNR